MNSSKGTNGPYLQVLIHRYCLESGRIISYREIARVWCADNDGFGMNLTAVMRNRPIMQSLYKAANFLKRRGYIEECGKGEFRITDKGRVASIKAIAAARSDRRTFQIEEVNEIIGLRMKQIFRVAMQFEPRIAEFIDFLVQINGCIETEWSAQFEVERLKKSEILECAKFLTDSCSLQDSVLVRCDEDKKPVFMRIKASV